MNGTLKTVVPWVAPILFAILVGLGGMVWSGVATRLDKAEDRIEKVRDSELTKDKVEHKALADGYRDALHDIDTLLRDVSDRVIRIEAGLAKTP